MRDGDIDYSKYTLLELEEALAGINRHKYPQNYANLRSAYERVTATPAQIPRPESITISEQEPAHSGPWQRFWGSRPIAVLMGAVCMWWAYDLLTQTESCPSSRKLMGTLVNSICENFGHAAAAGVPFILGFISVVFAVLPRRRAGA